jgi:hypothetical protein
MSCFLIRRQISFKLIRQFTTCIDQKCLSGNCRKYWTNFFFPGKAWHVEVEQNHVNLVQNDGGRVRSTPILGSSFSGDLPNKNDCAVSWFQVWAIARIRRRRRAHHMLHLLQLVSHTLRWASTPTWNDGSDDDLIQAVRSYGSGPDGSSFQATFGQAERSPSSLCDRHVALSPGPLLSGPLLF